MIDERCEVSLAVLVTDRYSLTFGLAVNNCSAADHNVSAYGARFVARGESQQASDLTIARTGGSHPIGDHHLGYPGPFNPSLSSNHFGDARSRTDLAAASTAFRAAGSQESLLVRLPPLRGTHCLASDIWPPKVGVGPASLDPPV